MCQSPPQPDWSGPRTFRSLSIHATGCSEGTNASTRDSQACMMSCTKSKAAKMPKRVLQVFPKQRDFTRPSSRFSLLLCSVLIILSAAGCLASSRQLDRKSSQQLQPTAATNAYGEPIKWSFGGWAPLDGQQPGANKNQTVAGSTTPLPPMMDPSNPHRTTATAGLAVQQTGGKHQSNRTQQNGRRPGVNELMNESASSTHGKVQFVAPHPEGASGAAARPSPPPQHQHEHQHHLYQPQQQHHQLHSGLAYALSMGQRQSHFSPPAPMPIVREHLLPSAANFYAHHQRGGSRGSLGPHHMPRHQQQQQHHHHHHPHARQQMTAQQYPRPPLSVHEHHQRQLEHQARQHMMMRHHQMMMQQHPHPHHPSPHQMMQHDQQQQQQQVRGAAQQPAAMIEGGYRVVEGEHPILFTPPAGMLDPVHNYTEQQQQQPRQQQQQQGSQTAAPYASTLAAIEKGDSLNYQQALRQVTSGSAPYGEPQQSNNIQDIKQKQQYEQQQPDNGNKEHPHSSSGGNNNKPGSYLTIPVAVETEGDKVLTADDINEIEKHVIQVLPNLKTADKVVKLADTKLTLASGNLKDAIQQTAAAVTAAAAGPAILHQLNYDEHRTTMKQLENERTTSGAGNSKQRYSQQFDSSTQPPSSTAMPSTSYSYAGGSSSSSGGPSNAALNQATTNAHVQHQQPGKSIEHEGQQQQELAEQQCFLATGPMQEVGTVVDSDQLAEYNLIKNDLLQNFRYEPTRATSNSNSHHQQTASTPPMPYTASQPPQPPHHHHHHQQQQQQQQQPQQHKPASVTRYFQQGNQMYQQHQLTSDPGSRAQQQQQSHMRQSNHPNNNLFGRIQTPSTRGYGGQQSSTTKTILGGRKVSEVMRNLIHTTPVPMTSPMHVASVEPEKVDAIQLIASNGNDHKPVVVEPHQLVQHTPEGGFDYNSGGMQNNGNNNYSSSIGPQYHQEQQQQQPSQNGPNNNQQQQQQQSGGGAIIEYVAVGEQALNGALNGAQNEGTYEIANQPELVMQPVYHNGEEQRHPTANNNANDAASQSQQQSSRPPFVYDYTMSSDQPQTASSQGASSSSGEPTTYSMGSAPNSNYPQQQQQQHEPQMFTWSPSIANEHQQQQAELNEHAAPNHQMQEQMPATAGYNFFSNNDQQQQQQVAKDPAGQEYDQQQQQQQQQQQYQEQPQLDGKWRSKAGGRQPNPDAQYDGQIVKGASDDHESEHDEAQNSNQQSGAEIEQQQQQQQQYNPAATTNEGYRGQQGDNAAAYQQQKQQQAYQQQQQQQEQQTLTSPTNQQDGYLATNSYAAGAQFNHQTPSSENYDQQQDYDQSRQQQLQQQQQPMQRFNYVKLDHDRQQSHLVQQQAQRQAQIAEIMSTNNQQVYQTTTPMTLTTLASVDPQQQQQQSQAGDDQTQQAQQTNQNDYGQDQSLPSVQSSPESMMINESPIGVPILDQQSLISDPGQDSSQELSSDDGGKQSQPAAVYQVYQAYYAPKDHKPLPGYVRLSLEEFNELFRDAEIQYVDRNNLNGLAADAANQQQQQQQSVSPAAADPQQHSYEQAGQNDHMKAAASDQSIVVDRRSITSERRSSNVTATAADTESSKTENRSRKLKFGGAVKKIISIRNSRQAARQQLLKGTILKHKGQKQPAKPETGSSTLSPSFSASSNNHPTTKQQLNVSSSVSSQRSIISKQQPTNKRKSDAVAAAAKKPSALVAQSQQMPAKASMLKDNKIEKAKLLSSVSSLKSDSGKRSSVPTGAANHKKSSST